MIITLLKLECCLHAGAAVVAMETTAKKNNGFHGSCSFFWTRC